MAIGFRAASTPAVTTNTSGVSAVTVPSTVQSGDFLLAVFASGAATGTSSLAGGPGGWTQLDSQQSSDTYTLWWKIAGSSDASSTITATASAGSVNCSLACAAYAGCDQYNPVLVFSSQLLTSAVTALTTPVVSTTIDGAVTVNIAAIKSSATSWTTPSGYVQRSAAVSSGPQITISCLFDDNKNNDLNSITSGTTYGGQTATQSTSANHGYVASLALLPATVAVYPTSDVSNPGGWVPTPSGNLYAALNDYPVTGTTYVTSPSVPSAAAFTEGLGAAPTPGINTGWAIGIETGYVSASSGTVVVTLLNSGTTVTSWTVTLNGTQTMYLLPLTATQAASIAGSSALEVTCSATAS